MNTNRGQTVLGLVLAVGVFILVWVFLAPVMNQQVASASNLNAMEAFTLNNLHFAIGLALAIFTMRVFGGPSR